MDCTFTKNKALQGEGGAINFASYDKNINILVSGSVFESNEASIAGGAARISNATGEKVNVGWINNNELIFGNTAGERCGDIFYELPDTCVSVGDNFSV